MGRFSNKAHGAARQVVFCGALPPPVHGMAVVNAAILDALGDICPLVINLARYTDSRILRGHLAKAYRALVGAVRLLTLRLPADRVFYAGCEDGLGGVYIVLMCMIARLRGMEIFIHHHSFRYILKTTYMMRMIVWFAGAKATHICLCHEMARLFGERYPGAGEFLICSNIVDDDVINAAAQQLDVAAKPIFTLGLLSNLTFEKGVDDFIATFRALRAAGHACSAILAGGTTSMDVERFLHAAVAEFSGDLEWLGPVYGEDKAAFFADIDVFVFPTRYPAESFGLVLLEALRMGAPIITQHRGCLPVLGNAVTSQFILGDENFPQEAVRTLQDWAADPEALSERKAQAHAMGAKLDKQFRGDRDHLIERLRHGS